MWSLMYVIDASVVVAALVDVGPDGIWAESILEKDPLLAPHLMLVEVTNVLRRSVLAGSISDETASLALSDLMSLPVSLFPYEPFAARVWELRGNVTAYDAWYVALAESASAKLATLDFRLSGATGPRCKFATPAVPGRAR
jgi:predicted nucleic acid-binding protein